MAARICNLAMAIQFVIAACSLGLMALGLSGCGGISSYSCSVSCFNGDCKCTPSNCDQRCETTTTTTTTGTTTSGTTTTGTTMWGFNVKMETLSQGFVYFTCAGNSKGALSYDFSFSHILEIANLSALWTQYAGLYNESYNELLQRDFDSYANSTEKYFVKAKLMNSLLQGLPHDNSSRAEARNFLQSFADLPVHQAKYTGKVSFDCTNRGRVTLRPCYTVLVARIWAGSDWTHFAIFSSPVAFDVCTSNLDGTYQVQDPEGDAIDTHSAGLTTQKAPHDGTGKWVQSVYTDNVSNAVMV